jgi:phage terminase large subunit-like protein
MPTKRAATTNPGDQAVRFLSNLTLVGDYLGQPFSPRPWQADIARRLFGTLRDDGRRQYKRMFLALPRKQAKTTLTAGLAGFMLTGEGRGKGGQQIYSASGDHKQAALIFRTLASMIRADPFLNSKCLIYETYKRIEFRPLENTYEALSSEAGLKHGLSPSAVLFDEVHVLPNRELHDALTTGYGARLEPLTVYITTAGYDRTSLCWELWDYARQVRDGVVDDPTFLPILYEAATEDDWTDPAVWRRVMPALGDFCSLEFIQEECKRAQNIPSYENTFRQLYLNQWTEQAERWLSTEAWAACQSDDTDPPPGTACYAGLDLGVTGDMSALVLVFPDSGGRFQVRCKFWAPAEGRWRRELRNGELYRIWQRAGRLEWTDGETTDFDQVERDILALNERWPFLALYADRAYASHLLTRLFNNHGLNVKGISQGPVTLNEAMVRLEASIIDRKVSHDGDPVLAWNVANAVVKRQSTGLMNLDKATATNRIDGLAALVNALTAARDVLDGGPSVYDERGLLWV